VTWSISVRLLIVFVVSTVCSITVAQNCYTTNIASPAPFLGNHNEIFRTSDGKSWQVKYSYEYLYEYYPEVHICNNSKLVIASKTLDIVPIRTGSQQRRSGPPVSNYPVKVILKPRGCRDYFLADGDSGGIYLLEWYGGYDPSVGDSILGDLKTYGFKDVIYPETGNSGRLYVDDYMLSRSRALEKLQEKCR